jgi:hypothetical protein
MYAWVVGGIAVVSLSLSACDSKPQSSGSENGGAGSTVAAATGEALSATFTEGPDSRRWVATEGITAYLSSNGTLNVAAVSGTMANNISLGVRSPAPTGTPTPLTAGTLTVTIDNRLFQVTEATGPGTLTITAIKPKQSRADHDLVRGTFSAKVTDGKRTIVITDGAFSGY